MASPVFVALLWHQHQPFYPDSVAGENWFPWVRLHGTKDYWGMAWHLQEVPEFYATINLVPSLLQQLQAYVDGTISDRHLDLSRIPADSLSQADILAIFETFFMANQETMIKPFPRYWELLQKRNSVPGEDYSRIIKRFSERDLRDLQVWSNLVWFHPVLFERDNDLQAFRQKERNYSENDKLWLLHKQKQVLAEIIPLHKQLMQRGQLDITASPYYHPILPLLWDKRVARQALPQVTLPKFLDSYADDVHIQLQRAVELHQRLFDRAPRGLWPSEGSVSQDIIRAVADAGFHWMATDEEILAQSTDGRISRDSAGFVRNPELFYRPWKVEHSGRNLQVIFRDHALSDLIGFHYQRQEPRQAAQDLLARIEAIGRALPSSRSEPALVPIILDGENCWEYYPDGGVQFLRTFYRLCVDSPVVTSTTVSDYLHRYPATEKISQLFAGSWIGHNFSIWIGHPEDNLAWDMLHQTREFLKNAQRQGMVPQEILNRAWEEIYIAEGSDWFWWFGDEHHSVQNPLFDQLFRKHLKNVYLLLKAPYPLQLDKPIQQTSFKPLHSQPRGYLPVKVDGRETYFEWIHAGVYQAGSERSTMNISTPSVIRQLLFGFDDQRWLLRCDTWHQAAHDLSPFDALHIEFVQPTDYVLRLEKLNQRRPEVTLIHQGRTLTEVHLEAAIGHILECALPLSILRLQAGDLVEFYVLLFQKGMNTDRLPREGLISLTCPPPDYEYIMWQA